MKKKILEELLERYPKLVMIKSDIENAYSILIDCFKNGGKLLIAGNGGSAADAEHIVGELMKSFVLPRPISQELVKRICDISKEDGSFISSKIQCGLSAIALTNETALNTAYLNDVDGSLCFAQQVNCYGKKGDVFLGISTSGNSKNIIYATIVAKALGMKTIGLLGKSGGILKEYCDVSIVAPEQETYKIQELHLPIYHALCLMLEEEFFHEHL